MGLKSFFRRKIRDYKLGKSGVIIGKGTIINIGFSDFGSEPYLIRIGEQCAIASGVKFITHDGGLKVFNRNPGYSHINKFGTIQIKDNVHVGSDAIILPNVTIGPNSVVGAGAVVRRSIPPNVVVAGNPARVVCTLEEYIEICKEGTIPFPESYPCQPESQKRKIQREVLEKHFWGK